MALRTQVEIDNDPFLTGSTTMVGVRQNRGGPSWLLSLCCLDAPEALPSGSTVAGEHPLLWREDAMDWFNEFN